MRARLVLETLDFERGGDPKKSLQIGDAATYQKIADKMKNDGWTPNDPYQSDSAIGWAVEYGNLEYAKFLLDRHGLPQEDAGTLISWASQADFIEMVELLLSHKPDPHKLDYALRMAVGNDPIWEVINNYIEEAKVHESVNFERGQEPKEAMKIGKNRLVKKGEPITIYFQGEPMDAIALEDEEETGQANYLDFMDSDGGICWAIKDNSDENPSWRVAEVGQYNESLDFERGQDPKKAMSIGKTREIHKGDRFLIRNYYDGKMTEVTAVSDESSEWGADDQPETEIEVQFDDYAGAAYAYKEEDGTWTLGE